MYMYVFAPLKISPLMYTYVHVCVRTYVRMNNILGLLLLFCVSIDTYKYNTYILTAYHAGGIITNFIATL